MPRLPSRSSLHLAVFDIILPAIALNSCTLKIPSGIIGNSVPSQKILDGIYGVHEMITPKIRLHVSPFSPDLLSAVLPSSIAHLAENISYHTLETFPENQYGYLELPSMEAEKLKKKLNGSILKGKKIRIDEARPRKRAVEDSRGGGQDESVTTSGESSRRPKRTKRDPATISGHELSPDRKIKRGWTEPTKAKGRKSAGGASVQASSKYTDKEEVLFRTKVPHNKAQAPKELSRKDKKNSQAVLVHEFEKSTTQPSFLRVKGGSDIKRVTEYMEGQGWVDEHGEVVEEEPARLRKRDHQSHRAHRRLPMNDEAKQAIPQADSDALDDEAEPDDETSSAGSSSEGSSSDSESEPVAASSQRDASNATSVEDSDSQKTPTPSVHPLEAIFKRPGNAASVDVAQPSLEVQTSFSFFEPDLESTTFMPETPFNSQELRSRELRSAAPTPDTAALSRFNSWGSRGVNSVPSAVGNDDRDDEDEDEDEDGDEGAANHPGQATPSKTTSAGEQGQPESEFAKFFWGNRGENNRTWKRRAREAKKEKRQRENRQRSRRL